jgi:hypothetical protein
MLIVNGCNVFICLPDIMEQHGLKNDNNCLNTNIYSHLETSGGQNNNLYLNAVHFLTPVLIRHLWQLKTVVSLHGCFDSVHVLIFVDARPHP